MAQISTVARKELLQALSHRYRVSSKKEKSLILNEFVAVSGYHRKHSLRFLSCNGAAGSSTSKAIQVRAGHRIYDHAVKEALIVTWEAADRICGKRLEAKLPDLVNAMERHGHLSLDSDVHLRKP